jgi:hypothetical protein
MPSKYLFLSSTDSDFASTTITWNNIPTLSESTRECYVSILDMDVLFDDGQAAPNDSKQIFVRLNLPSLNYFSTTNTEPVMRYLSTNQGFKYIPNLQESVELLTNDNLKKIEVQLFDSAGLVIPTSFLESINLTLKIDYVDQQAMTQQYLSQKPRTL